MTNTPSIGSGGLCRLHADRDRIRLSVQIEARRQIDHDVVITGVQVLDYNQISDINALSGLTSLTDLRLGDNLITDISALSGLTSLTNLALANNPDLTDIQPLLHNTGLGAGDLVGLRSTSVSCADVAALKAKGVAVFSDCP